MIHLVCHCSKGCVCQDRAVGKGQCRVILYNFAWKSGLSESYFAVPVAIGIIIPPNYLANLISPITFLLGNQPTDT